MEINRLDDRVSSGTQPGPGDLQALYDAGFRSVICNRPDGEAADQPAFSDIERAAARLGMPARHLPVVFGDIVAEHGVAFARLLAELPGPVFAYCRTGKRAAALWELARTGARPGR